MVFEKYAKNGKKNICYHYFLFFEQKFNDKWLLLFKSYENVLIRVFLHAEFISDFCTIF